MPPEDFETMKYSYAAFFPPFWTAVWYLFVEQVGQSKNHVLGIHCNNCPVQRETITVGPLLELVKDGKFLYKTTEDGFNNKNGCTRRSEDT